MTDRQMDARTGRDRTRRALRARRDRGTSFIEVLVAVVIIGTAGIAVLTALGAAATGAATNREVSEAQSALATAGDVVADADIDHDTYVACARPSDYAAVAAAAAPGVTVTDVEYWTGSAWSSSVADCAYGTGERLQRVTLSITVASAPRTLSVVKRPATDPTVGVGPLSPATGGNGFGNVTITPTPGVTG